MSVLGVYDNWGRLVAAVTDREKLQQLAFCDSFSSTSSSVAASLSRLNSVSSTFDFGAFGNELDQVTAPSSTRRGGVAAFLFAGPLAYYRRRKLQEHERKLRDLFVSNFFFDVPAHQLDQLERFSLGELKLATDNFSDENVIGRGGFGKVYKGRLADGSLVAVKKKTEEHNTSGYDQQFRAEIKVKLNTGEHPNILQLRGFCLTATERILVYPFIANRTLALCLWERTESQPPLDWPTRERIALSSAKGLAYLHDQCDKKIIHRDIKAANILLNEDLEAVIGDFGLAKFMEHEDTHVTTAVRGTMGHIAPEYRSNGTVSEKTDVFGYGVMLLELSTGQRAFDLARHANYENAMLLDLVKALSKKKFEALVDADLRVNYLRGSYIDGKVVKLIQVALLCCQGSPEKRPKMSDVIQMLQGDNGFSERWQKYWKEEEILPQEYSYAHYHPITDWIVDSIPREFELSGPR